MPIKKFRSIEEMDDAQWYEAGDPSLHEAIARVWRFGTENLRPQFPPGVYRYRSIEEADAAQERWAQQNFEAFQKRKNEAARRRAGETETRQGRSSDITSS
ncbi:MAG: hypothetical protein MPN21_22485 [Thermoanaerobaculia bacterium]|nr:hypothetical protein [Thermoanaerobaculia bacterium]